MILALALACIHFPATPNVLARPERDLASVLITDVRVFTAGPEGVLEHRDVRLADGLISDVVPAGSGLTADRTLDGAGRTLMPGLVDLHVHLALSGNPPWYLTLPDPRHAATSTVYAGITTVLDVGGDTAVLSRLKASIARGAWLGPRIYYAGPGLTVEDGYPLDMMKDVYGDLAFASIEGKHFLAIRDVADIERQVDDIADQGGSFVKLMVASIPPMEPPAPQLSEAMVVAATRRAHERGLKVAAHIDDTDDALLCARAGVDLLAHGVETSRLTADEIEVLRASGIAVEPTLVNWRRFDAMLALDYQATRSEVATQPKAVLASFSAERLEAHRALLEESTFKSWADALAAHRDDRLANAVALYAAGVPLRVGSDSGGSIGTFAGSLHEELRLLAEAGIPVEAVLVAATSGNARFLDPDARFGSVQVGYIADLLLVDGDPTVDLAHTEDLVQVFVGGAPVRP